MILHDGIVFKNAQATILCNYMFVKDEISFRCKIFMSIIWFIHHHLFLRWFKKLINF